MPQPEEMAMLIRRLGGADSGEREKAAREIFRQGEGLARAATAKWFADAEMSDLFVHAESDLPQTTVGIAVGQENFNRIRTANGSPRLADVPPDQDAEEYELHFGRGVRLDVLTTQDPQGGGAIARFLQKSGEGIQQVEFLIRGVDRASKVLSERFGLQPIYPATRAGADGTRVNFFLATTPQGKKVLIELVEASARSKTK
ncbi:MAG: hypothetical protein ACRD5M_11860 [Candidatus Acidiferrales bacterium]